jgi:hypothetical protein
MGVVGFLFWSVIALAPVLVAVSVAGRSVRSDRLSRLGPLAVVIGFLAGGAVGWASVPAEWTASFWTTIEAAGNAAKYGESLELVVQNEAVHSAGTEAHPTAPPAHGRTCPHVLLLLCLLG